MFCLHRPDERRIRDYLARRAAEGFSYAAVGLTRDADGQNGLHGWCVDHHRVLLGRGEETFRRARLAIEAWRMFPPEITSVHGKDRPHGGLAVVVSFRAWPLPLWLLMPARVVYLLEDTIVRRGQPIDRFGFAYGTLPGHPERGEERFMVERNREDDSVYYDLLAVSQPAHWLVRLGYPYARRQQARFRRLSGIAMQRAVAE